MLFKIGEVYKEPDFQDALEKGVISDDEFRFCNGGWVLYSGQERCRKHDDICDKLIHALEKEQIKFIEWGNAKAKKLGVYIHTDYIDGPGGQIINHANGKIYDSKSKYYADLKASGHVVVESGMDKKREQRGDYNVQKELKEAAQKHGLIS